MSSILKALQRVEQERPPGAAAAPRRALRSDFIAAKAAPLLRRRPRAPKLGGGRLFGALGAALLLAAFVWWRLPERSVPEPEPTAAADRQAEQPELARSAPEPAAPAPAPPAPPPAAAPEPAAPGNALAESPGGADVPAAPPSAATAPGLPLEVAERLPPLGSTLDAPPPAPVEPAHDPEAEPAEARSPETAAAPPAPPEPAPAPAREEPAPPSRAEAAPAPEPAAAPPAPKPAPKRAAPKAPPREVARAAPPKRPAPAARPAPKPPSAPAVLVERTRWHPNAERRVVWVSVDGFSGARELHEGDAVGALVVKEIRPSSVVFLHGADTLQRRIGVRE